MFRKDLSFEHLSFGYNGAVALLTALQAARRERGDVTFTLLLRKAEVDHLHDGADLLLWREEDGA